MSEQAPTPTLSTQEFTDDKLNAADVANSRNIEKVKLGAEYYDSAKKEFDEIVAHGVELDKLLKALPGATPEQRLEHPAVVARKLGDEALAGAFVGQRSQLLVAERKMEEHADRLNHADFNAWTKKEEDLAELMELARREDRS